MRMDADEAGAWLGHLLAPAEAGEDVQIVRDGMAIARIVPIAPAARQLGILEGLVDPDTIPDFIHAEERTDQR